MKLLAFAAAVSSAIAGSVTPLDNDTARFEFDYTVADGNLEMTAILAAKSEKPYVSTIVEVILGEQMTDEQKREWRTHTEEVKGYNSWASGFTYIYYPE